MGRGLIRGAALLLAAVAMAALWGCGGGSSSTSSESETTAASTAATEAAPAPNEISDAKFVKQANKICEEGKKGSLKKVSAYLKEHKGDSEGSKQKPLSNLAKAIQAVIVPGIGEQVEEIRALEVSGADQAKVNKFLKAMEEAVEKAEGTQGSSGAVFSKSFKSAGELAREYGLETCAYG